MELKNYGAGLGLRFSFIEDVANDKSKEIDFFEVSPENYIDRGGRVIADFEKVAEHYPILTHGLSLSIGSLDELNWNYLKKLKTFIQRYNIPWFTDHLCFSSSNAHEFHDLLPLPLTMEAVKHVSERAKVVQDFLECPLALENVSFYMHPVVPEMTETQFIKEVLNRSGAALLLDVNNVYVNSVNHEFDAKQMITDLSDENILHIHIAGHYQESEDLIIDTHGAEVSINVWELLQHLGTLRELPSVLLERDHNIPNLSELIPEIRRIKEIQKLSKTNLRAA